jgi:hypothetical protein
VRGPEDDDDEEDCDDDDEELFDADELGLDPEEDDVRGYGKDAALIDATVNLTLFKLGLF